MLPPPPPPRLLREGAAGCSDWLKCEAWVEDLRGTLSSGMSSPHAAASAAAGDRVRGGARAAPPPLPPPPLPRGPTAWARLPSCMGSRSVPSCSAESSWCAAASNSSGVISMASCISREAARTNSGSQYLPKPWSLSTCNQDAKIRYTLDTLILMRVTTKEHTTHQHLSYFKLETNLDCFASPCNFAILHQLTKTLFFKPHSFPLRLGS